MSKESNPWEADESNSDVMVQQNAKLPGNSSKISMNAAENDVGMLQSTLRRKVEAPRCNNNNIPGLDKV